MREDRFTSTEADAAVFERARSADEPSERPTRAEAERDEHDDQRDCPDCEQGKHANCLGDAWSNKADDWVPCPCADRGHDVTYHVKHVSTT